MYVVRNSSAPESTLRKKCNSICYHTVCEAVAAKEIIVAHEPGDLLTKPVLGGQHHEELVHSVLLY
jgi:hypothetical protein